jgi:hypothetical protein
VIAERSANLISTFHQDERERNMKTPRRLILSMGALALMGPGCANDTMSMSDEVAGLTSHQAALEAELIGHHRNVLEADDMARVRSFEAGFGQTSLGHMDEMDHRMRDMQGMCSMGGHNFDGGPMVDTIGRVRMGLGEHQRRMGATNDLNALRLEEGAFRDTMTTLMTEMRSRQSAMRDAAAQYTCRMHGH